MKRKTEEEIKEFFFKLPPYSPGEVEIEIYTPEHIRVNVHTMYTNPFGRGLTFDQLKKVSDFFGTLKVNNDDINVAGCGSCVYFT